MEKSVLVTTAISYPNDDPHIGHLYESILADFICRSYRCNGCNSLLLSGTDEHGKKIQQTAEKAGMNPMEFCNSKTQVFRQMNIKAQNNVDNWIRTTDLDHITTVENALTTGFANGTIMPSTYEGWYCIREEKYISEHEAKSTNYKDAVSGAELIKMSENSYVLKSKGEAEADTDNDAIHITRLTKDVPWAIKLPWNHDYTVYVWYDALLNYVTGAKRLFHDVVPETHHVIGKDIDRFHRTIYPIILESCESKYRCGRLIVHGFITDAQGNKMSKSLGNVIDPDSLLKEFPVEAVRYYFIFGCTLGEDFKFSKETLKNFYLELKNCYGNLFQRIYKCAREHGITIPEPQYSKLFPCFDQMLQTLDLQQYRAKLLEYCHIANKFWQDNLDRKSEAIHEIVQQFVNISWLLKPVIPEKTSQLLELLGKGNIDHKPRAL